MTIPLASAMFFQFFIRFRQFTRTRRPAGTYRLSAAPETEHDHACNNDQNEPDEFHVLYRIFRVAPRRPFGAPEDKHSADEAPENDGDRDIERAVFLHELRLKKGPGDQVQVFENFQRQPDEDRDGHDP